MFEAHEIFVNTSYLHLLTTVRFVSLGDVGTCLWHQHSIFSQFFPKVHLHWCMLLFCIPLLILLLCCFLQQIYFFIYLIELQIVIPRLTSIPYMNGITYVSIFLDCAFLIVPWVFSDIYLNNAKRVCKLHSCISLDNKNQLTHR
jgi:hypothetical protein